MGKLTPERRDRLAREFGNRCWYCQLRLNGDVSWEHLVPRSRGGSNKISNLRPAHGACNAVVGNLPIDSKYRLRELAISEGSDVFFIQAMALSALYGRKDHLAVIRHRRRPKKASAAYQAEIDVLWHRARQRSRPLVEEFRSGRRREWRRFAPMAMAA